MVKLGINGFGRLGKQLLRLAINKCKKKCAADVSRILMVNDPNMTSETMAYQLRNDTLYGKFDAEVVEMGSSLMVDGQRVEITSEQKIEKIPWKNCNIEYVIDTTGRNTNCNKASVFLTEGIKRVIVTRCSNVPIFVVGVNHACFELNMKTVSAGTPSLNCLLPVLRVLHENFQIEEAMTTVLEPMNNQDKILDEGYGTSGNRSSRSCLNSFAPTSTPSTSQKFVDRLMPELEKKTESTAIKIPAPCVGAVIVTAKLGKEAPYELVKHRFKEASQTYMKGMIRYAEDDLVSSDIIGDSHSCVFDARAGVGLTKCLIKVFAWYDSESGFANRVYDLANYIDSRENCSK